MAVVLCLSDRKYANMVAHHEFELRRGLLTIVPSCCEMRLRTGMLTCRAAGCQPSWLARLFLPYPTNAGP